jgi:uncharacterized protein (DUF1501 family)
MIHRRDFLRLGGLAGLSLGLPSGLEAWLARGDDRRDGDGPVLVLIELTGGNDGLNTIVPHGDDRYHRARPSLRIAPAAVHRIDDVLGFAPALKKTAALFSDGGLVVAQGVGMPNPDRSHFTSLDRWHTGLVDEVPREPGWIGRAPGSPGADRDQAAGFALGERAMPRILQDPERQALCAETLEELVPKESVRKVLGSEALARLDAAAGSADDRKIADGARALLRRLDAMLARSVAADAFPSTRLGGLLGDASRIIDARLGVPAIFVRQGGFDTHVRQADVQPQLLTDLDGALAAFAAAIRKRKLQPRVLVVVYSEFGRRVAENGSRGTDHGSGAPVLLFGGGLTGRVIGENPDLAHLDDGDVRATTDFRRVLALGLKHLGHPDPAEVFGAGITPIV